MLARQIHHLSYFGFSYFVRVNAADANPLLVDVEHDMGRLLVILVEEALQDHDDELHRRVVVIEQEDLVQTRLLGLRARPGDHIGPGVAGGLIPIVSRHFLDSILCSIARNAAIVTA